MGDMGDIFRDMREYKKERKEKNLDRNIQKLDEAAIPYKCLNGLLHLRLILDGKKLDFWPTTNLCSIGGKYYSNGINFILKRFKNEMDSRGRDKPSPMD